MAFKISFYHVIIFPLVVIQIGSLLLALPWFLPALIWWCAPEPTNKKKALLSGSVSVGWVINLSVAYVYLTAKHMQSLFLALTGGWLLALACVITGLSMWLWMDYKVEAYDRAIFKVFGVNLETRGFTQSWGYVLVSSMGGVAAAATYNWFNGAHVRLACNGLNGTYLGDNLQCQFVDDTDNVFIAMPYILGNMVSAYGIVKVVAHTFLKLDPNVRGEFVTQEKEIGWEPKRKLLPGEA